MSNVIAHFRDQNAALLRDIPLPPMRALASEIDWKERLIGLYGPKGVGKTTTLLTRLATEQDRAGALYISLDHPLISGHSLIELAEHFYRLGGHLLLLDEVHKYEGWSSHLKALYDQLPRLKVVFSGSSTLHLQQGRADLSRRASMYKMPIISFREFIAIETKLALPKWPLEAILTEHRSLASDEVLRLKPLKFFESYLTYGAYPFYQEGQSRYHHKLLRAINHTLESDLVFVHGLDARYSAKLKGVLNLVATSVPFTPKISDIAQAIEISRPTVSHYLRYLEEGGIISLLPQAGKGYSRLAKPEKIYLDNTNLLIALGRSLADIGTRRETFAASQLREAGHKLEGSAECDFLVDGKHLIEIGGPNKPHSRKKTKAPLSLFCDDIELGERNQIPLWMLGFLY